MSRAEHRPARASNHVFDWLFRRPEMLLRQVHAQIPSGAPRKGYCRAAAGLGCRFARLGCSNRAGATRATVSLHIEPPSKAALLRKAAARGGVRTR